MAKRLVVIAITRKLRSYTPAGGRNASSRRIFVGQILGLKVRYDLDIEQQPEAFLVFLATSV
jgi:hypothetical protein